ncbi:hypothetical protein [Streptomyces sp. CB00316]|uniref:hypothetical protein n=1 Tax=Streptomyces sp. CB00316 TaxID=1703932 RepID=UPI001F28A5BD|nr:hypothetical protein [Streptomyces sp. CB00316]
MAMELDDPGFHHSVLADFRDRLAEADRADRLLDLAPARLKGAGLVHERTTQRTDSTRRLTRGKKSPSRLPITTAPRSRGPLARASVSALRISTRPKGANSMEARRLFRCKPTGRLHAPVAL